VVFLTAGDDHHTLALQEAVSLSPLGLFRGLRRLGSLLRGRRSAARSEAGKRRVLPPLSVVRASMRVGFNHAGYRVESEEELRGYVRRLRSAGVSIDWMVNHHDMVKGVYFRDPAGNLCELFVDGERARELARKRENGASLEELVMNEELRNYELSPAEIGL
jgi:catechol 2,3-dioxygenase-like lactoylglutathione lyase family enzyme